MIRGQMGGRPRTTQSILKQDSLSMHLIFRQAHIGPNERSPAYFAWYCQTKHVESAQQDSLQSSGVQWFVSSCHEGPWQLAAVTLVGKAHVVVAVKVAGSSENRQPLPNPTDTRPGFTSVAPASNKARPGRIQGTIAAKARD